LRKKLFGEKISLLQLVFSSGTAFPNAEKRRINGQSSGLKYARHVSIELPAASRAIDRADAPASPRAQAAFRDAVPAKIYYTRTDIRDVSDSRLPATVVSRCYLWNV
jgi:hypothetical protein